MVLTVIDGTSRLWGGGLLGSVEICQMLLVAVAFGGLAWAEVTNSHVRVDVLYEHLPRRVQAGMNFFVYLIYAAIIIFLLYANILYEGEQFAKAEVTWVGASQVALWPTRLSLTLGLFIFCVIIVVETVRSAKFIHKEKRET